MRPPLIVSGTVESYSCQISLSSHHIKVLLVYRSPSSTESGNDIVLRVLQTVAWLHCECLILGDYNALHVNWLTRSCSIPNPFSNKLLTVADEEFLYQAITSPTQYRTCHLPSTLDLDFYKYSSGIRSIDHLAQLGKSDHPTLQLNFAVSDLPAGNLYKPNGVLIKLTYRGFGALLTVSTGPQYHKWHTWTTNCVT